MKTVFFKAVVVACLFLACQKKGLADPILEPIQNIYSGLNPGDQFVVSLNVNNPDTVTVIAYDFSVIASHSNIFTVDSQMLEFPLDEPNYSSFPYLVSTTFDAGADFGAYSLGAGFDNGVSLAQSLTFSINPSAAPGTYTLTLNWNMPSALGGPNLVYDQAGNIFESQMASPILLTVNVVPEPTAMSMLVIGGLFGGLIFGRFRRLQ